MKNTILTFAFAILASYTIQAQGTGLIFDDEQFNKLPSFPSQNSGSKSIGNTPKLYVDLSPFAPPVVNQGEVNSCVAWATAYNAFTIQYAAKHDILNKETLKNIALSAMYPYKQLKPNNCQDGLQLPAVAEYINQNGAITFNDFPNTECISIPGSLYNRASIFRPFSTPHKVFERAVMPGVKIEKTIEQLSLFGAPVIVGIEINKDELKAYNPNIDLYFKPQSPIGHSDNVGHAVTVVAYDNLKRKAFKILNTWGENWGEKGYFWIKYEDYGRIAVLAEALILPDDELPNFPNSNTNINTSLQESKPITKLINNRSIGGKFAFQFLNNSSDFEAVKPNHSKNGIYELEKRNWKKGQLFQLITDNQKSGMHMCVFSIDVHNKLTVHWPRNKSVSAFQKSEIDFGVNEGSVLPKANFNLTIPSEDTALRIDEAGTDYLCVIYSDNYIDLENILPLIKNTNSLNIYDKIKGGLGKRLVNPLLINYSQNEMNFESKTDKGDVIPLILKIESVEN